MDSARIGENDAAAGQQRREMIGSGDQALEPLELLGASEAVRVEGAAIGEDGVGLSHSVERLRAFHRRHAGACPVREGGREPRPIGLRLGTYDQDIDRDINWYIDRYIDQYLGRHACTFMRSCHVAARLAGRYEGKFELSAFRSCQHSDKGSIEDMPELSERLNTPISTAELERRWKAVRAAMERDRIDVLVMQN